MPLFGWYGGLPDGGHVALASQIGIGAVLEVAGGFAIAAGSGRFSVDELRARRRVSDRALHRL